MEWHACAHYSNTTIAKTQQYLHPVSPRQEKWGEFVSEFGQTIWLKVWGHSLIYLPENVL